MNSFDCSNCKVIGYAEPRPTGHADILVIGYTETYGSWKFHPISKENACEIFPPKGKVFAHKFSSKNRHLDENFIMISVKENINENENQDQYICNYSEGIPDQFGDTIINIENNELSIEENLNKYSHEIKAPHYYRYMDRIYHVKPDTKGKSLKYTPFWECNNEKISDRLYSWNNKYFVLTNDLENPDGYIDIMLDQELSSFVENNLLSNQYPEIKNRLQLAGIENGDIFKHTEISNLPIEILENRLLRIDNLIDNLILIQHHLDLLAKNPLFASLIEKTVSAFESEYINRTEQKYKNNFEIIKKQYNELIIAENSKKENEINKLEAEKAEKRKEIESLLFQIKQYEDLISSNKHIIEEQCEWIKSIEKNKQRILEDFQLIKEVLSNNNSLEKNNSKSLIDLIPFDCLDTLEINNKKLLADKVKNSLKSCNISTEITVNLINLLISYRVLILPDVRIAHAIIKSTGKCNYIVQCCQVNWNSFSDLWNNGLSIILDSCIKNPQIMHYFVLQNINLSYLPCFMQPINDIIIGLRKSFPFTNGDIEFPSNLRILGIITTEEGMPLSLQSIRDYGCLTKANYEIEDKSYDTEVSPGYFTPSFLESLNKKEELSIQSDYKSYIIDSND